MNAFLAPTDKDWFDFLTARSVRGVVDEVNFWLPNPWGGRFGALTTGQPLLFKLKSPHNVVAGGGFFSHYTDLPISLAWDAFGPKNGAATLEEVRARIGRLRKETPRPWEDYTIGCILLAEPFFWDRADWIPQPPDWKPQIVRGKGYDLREEPGRSLWAQVTDRLLVRRSPRATGREPEPELPGLFGGRGDPTEHRPRIGQGIFTSLVRDHYERTCAISRERALPALEAAHIRPFSLEKAHDVQNGLLLRSDIHKLFDAGYLTVTPELRVEASRSMREDFNDGESYLKLHGRRVLVPGRPDARPDPERLGWHNDYRYRG